LQALWGVANKLSDTTRLLKSIELDSESKWRSAVDSCSADLEKVGKEFSLTFDRAASKVISENFKRPPNENVAVDEDVDDDGDSGTAMLDELENFAQQCESVSSKLHVSLKSVVEHMTCTGRFMSACCLAIKSKNDEAVEKTLEDHKMHLSLTAEYIFSRVGCQAFNKLLDVVVGDDILHKVTSATNATMSKLVTTGFVHSCICYHCAG
jgi:hypothetical protein